MTDYKGIDIAQALVVGDLNRIQTLYKQSPSNFNGETMLRAAELGHWDIVSFFIINGGSQMNIEMEGVPWPESVARTRSNLHVRHHFFEAYSGCCMCADRCDVGCPNLDANILCTRSNCSVGSHCGNRFMDEIPTERFLSTHGIGLRTKEAITKGQFIVEYIGEMISYDEVTTRNRDYSLLVKDLGYSNKKLRGVGYTVYIDARNYGNNSRFVNHSCRDHTCEMKEFVWKRSRRMGLFATRDILPGEELRFRYGSRDQLPFVCKCGSTPRCV